MLKVFKKGFSLRRLQSQWPMGILNLKGYLSSYITPLVCGGLVLKDDRFAFLLRRFEIDLRKLIDAAQEDNSDKLWATNGGPLRKFGVWLSGILDSMDAQNQYLETNAQ